MRHRRAIGRSFDIYYRDTDRTRRMDALNAQFIRSGGWAFDIGAHVGDRTASFRRLGARVVCVEPQQNLFRALRLIHGRDPQVHLVSAAVGASHGMAEMLINQANPTVSTLSRDLVSSAPASDAWRDQVWDTRAEVSVTTLDTLIASYGRPDFIKLDIEGYEHAALQGLTRLVPALSFEFTTLQQPVALACLDRLTALGYVSFNVSLGETHVFEFAQWCSLNEIQTYLAILPDAANSGDIYARCD